MRRHLLRNPAIPAGCFFWVKASYRCASGEKSPPHTRTRLLPSRDSSLVECPPLPPALLCAGSRSWKLMYRVARRVWSRRDFAPRPEQNIRSVQSVYSNRAVLARLGILRCPLAWDTTVSPRQGREKNRRLPELDFYFCGVISMMKMECGLIPFVCWMKRKFLLFLYPIDRWASSSLGLTIWHILARVI